MQNVSDLFAVAVETSIIERSIKLMPRDPQRNHTLVDFPHLPRAGQNAASIDEAFHSVIVNVLRDE